MVWHIMFYLFFFSFSFFQSYSCSINFLIWKIISFADTLPSLDTQKCSIDKGALSASATAYSPSTVQGTKDSKTSFSDTAGCDKVSAANQLENPQLRPSSSTSSSSEKLVETSTSSGLNLPPSSSVGFLASEKSTLNPHAKV